MRRADSVPVRPSGYEHDVIVDRNRNQIAALAFEIGAALSIIDDRSPENHVIQTVDEAAGELAGVLERLAVLPDGHLLVLTPIKEKCIDTDACGSGDFNPDGDQLGRCKDRPCGKWAPSGLNWLLGQLRASSAQADAAPPLGWASYLASGSDAAAQAARAAKAAVRGVGIGRGA